MSGTATATATASGEALVVSPVGVESEERVGQPTVEQLEESISEQLTGYGWKVWFEDEPDGGVTGYLRSWETGENLKAALAKDHVDAWLALGISTEPPSQEVRREQRRRDGGRG